MEELSTKNSETMTWQRITTVYPDYLPKILSCLGLVDAGHLRAASTCLPDEDYVNAVTYEIDRFVRLMTGGHFCIFCFDEYFTVIFEQFGHLVKFLTLDFRYTETIPWNDIFTIIQKQCPNLEKLMLLIDNCTVESSADVLTFDGDFNNVTDLYIAIDGQGIEHSLRTQIIDISSRCPELEHFILNFSGAVDIPDTFLQRNANLDSFLLSGNVYGRDFGKIVNNLIRFTHFTQFTVDLKRMDVLLRYIPRFNEMNLTHLRIDGFNYKQAVAPVLDQLPFESIKSLSLECAELTVADIAKLNETGLEQLRLYLCKLITLPFESLLILCGNGRLESLSFLIAGFECIDETKFLQMVARRQQSKPEKCLHIRLNTETYKKTVEAIPYSVFENYASTISFHRRECCTCGSISCDLSNLEFKSWKV